MSSIRAATKPIALYAPSRTFVEHVMPMHDEEIGDLPRSRGFTGMLAAYQPTGGTAHGDDIARLRKDRQRGDFVRLARGSSSQAKLAYPEVVMLFVKPHTAMAFKETVRRRYGEPPSEVRVVANEPTLSVRPQHVASDPKSSCRRPERESRQSHNVAPIGKLPQES